MSRNPTLVHARVQARGRSPRRRPRQRHPGRPRPRHQCQHHPPLASPASRRRFASISRKRQPTRRGDRPAQTRAATLAGAGGDPKKSRRYRQLALAVRYRMIEEEHGRRSVRAMCEALGVAPSAYYAWRCAPRERAGTEPTGACSSRSGRSTARAARRTARSGSTPSLRARGIACGKNRVARLMREHDIRARRPSGGRRR